MKPKHANPVSESILEATLLNTLLIEVTPPADACPPPNGWEKLIARVRTESEDNRNDNITIRANEDGWRNLTPLVRMKTLRDDGKTRTFLLHLAAGAMLPAHDHIEEEECLVLEGDAYIGDCIVHAGDYHLARQGSRHGVLGSQHGALLLLRGESERV
jgi:hypothetical protein